MPAEALRFPSDEALAAALAGRVAGALGRRLAADGRASLALSGGKTPRRFLTILGQASIDWPSVTVTLVDERWVGEASERSNARLVRETLLAGRASAARFVPLYTGDATPEAGLGAAEARLGTVPRPFAAVVLGMGEDGHAASWFPGGDRLAAAIDPAAGRDLETMRAPGAGEPRMTLTLPAVLDCDLLALHIEGTDKWSVYEEALRPGPVEALPIRAALRAAGSRLAVFWCP